jgi:hypothetical protein
MHFLDVNVAARRSDDLSCRAKTFQAFTPATATRRTPTSKRMATSAQSGWIKQVRLLVDAAL